MIDWKQYPDLKRMWSTRGARFACHQRLTKRNIWTSYTISLAAAYVIVLSLYDPMGFHVVNEIGDKILTLISIFISVVIIFLSLIESSSNSMVKAEALHANARMINEVYHAAEQKIKGCCERDGLVDISDEVVRYDAVVNGCDYNHETIDYLLFISQNMEDFPKFKSQVAFKEKVVIQVFFSQYVAFCICLIGIPALCSLVYAFFHA